MTSSAGRWGVVLAAATAGVLILVIWRWQPIPDTELPAVVRQRAVARSASPLHVDLSAAPAIVEAQRAKVDVPSIQVTDEVNQPLAGTGAWRLGDESRWLLREAPSFLGATAADGRLALEREPMGTVVLVARHGFLTESVPLSGGSDQRVRLRRGEPVEFRCLDQAKQPLPGVVVRASMSPIDINEDWPPLARALAEGGPGLDPARAVHFAVSDASGMVRVYGLSPGEVAWEAYAEGYMITAAPGLRPPDNERVTCPGRQYTLQFAPVYAHAFVVRGDRVSHCQGKPNGNWVYSALGAYQIARVTKRLQNAHPEWHVNAMAIADVEKPLTMTWDLVLAETGPQRITIPFRPLADLLRHGPEVIDMTSKARSSEVHAREVTVRLLNGDGKELSGCTIALADKQRDKMLFLRSGQRRSVPVGTYGITAAEASVNNSLPLPRLLTVDCSADVIDISLTRELRKVRVTKTTPDRADPPKMGALLFKHSNGGTMQVLFGDDPYVEAHLPLGRVTAELDRHGHLTARTEFDVVSGKDVAVEIPVGGR